MPNYTIGHNPLMYLMKSGFVALFATYNSRDSVLPRRKRRITRLGYLPLPELNLKAHLLIYQVLL